MTAWALPILRAQGFLYDSSYFPGAYGPAPHLAGRAPAGGLVADLGEGLWEVEVPSVPVAGRSVPWGGSGYFRLCPYAMFRLGVRRILRRRGQFVFYLHPWEIDPNQPRLGTSRLGRFRHYRNLHDTEARLRTLLQDFKFGRLIDVVDQPHTMRATAGLTGAYAEYTRVGAAATLRLPENVSFQEGALVEPLAVGLNAVAKARLEPGDSVLIVGAGPVGVAVALWCRFFGARHIVVSDLIGRRAERAVEFGATAAIDASDLSIPAASATAGSQDCDGCDRGRKHPRKSTHLHAPGWSGPSIQ